MASVVLTHTARCSDLNGWHTEPTHPPGRKLLLSHFFFLTEEGGCKEGVNHFTHFLFLSFHHPYLQSPLDYATLDKEYNEGKSGEYGLKKSKICNKKKSLKKNSSGKQKSVDARQQ